ncbi:BNR-4 repeat-containing protein [Botryobacter ruber]|uniref:BNR-4 repeat-containing protein n=1 Tax=Botryobacter ruber TaxID=2171629 RepID=UPI000E0AB33E|nr:BNR-4 repeat-containing protein [Botryobacter ruber]
MRKILLLGLLAVCGMAEAVAQQTFSISKLSEDANTRSDQRPIQVGFYDAGAHKTFVSWMGANSTAVVKALDHKTNTWSADKVVGNSPFVDKHNYPGLLKGADNRLYAFYGCHNSTMKLTISPKPLSIEGTWEDKYIEEAKNASYPAPVVTTDGTFYVFYRDTRKTNGYADDRPYQVVKSTDNGITWKRQLVIDPYPRSTDNMLEIYNGKVTYQPAFGDQKAKIHIAWTIAGEKLGKHAHATYGRNLYYAYLDPSNDHMYSISGKDLGTTIDNNEADAECMVIDTGIPEKGHMSGLQVSAHYRDNGFPIIHFDNVKQGGSSSATWNGKAWVVSQITPAGGDPREIEKFGPDSFRVYRPKGKEIAVYKTTNGGLSWELETTAHVGQQVDRVHVIENAHPDAKLLITEAGDGEIRQANRDVFIGKVTANYEPPYKPGSAKASGASTGAKAKK